ncbi:hypothetical protein GCM10022251_53940 [Phytohabitans flavus]|uniref:Uncharacterized protein n=1 Tax=Phytohabitans flavus TaxID=1076124 RepID=A0A6F8XM52_9ACTN|nr:hypothetical protein [Phytohabitans flavus]BCB74861.1 hypothetical protein Pflav_012710 [Phytohabitans flavus]
MAEVEATGRGARVLRTGIALVHEGELILPAAGSAAQAEQVLEDERAVVHYHFPVQIEVRGAVAVDVDELVDRALRRLAQGLEGA